MYDTLGIERSGPVATIWMNRPQVFNAFNELLIADLSAACAMLDEDASVRVVVLGGRGRHFSAGADLNWMRRAAEASEADNLEDARRFADMLRTLAGLSKPTIARIQGAALGGGTGLAAACDMAVASSDASTAGPHRSSSSGKCGASASSRPVGSTRGVLAQPAAARASRLTACRRFSAGSA